jgi:hypothetical protein
MESVEVDNEDILQAVSGMLAEAVAAGVNLSLQVVLVFRAEEPEPTDPLLEDVCGAGGLAEAGDGDEDVSSDVAGD